MNKIVREPKSATGISSCFGKEDVIQDEKDIAERIAEMFERDYANSYLRGDEVARIIRGRMK